ncbi:hypothetical protein RclHR1_00080017 [Rhizophagus clarus]|uniref:Uncharacterized protein n=1 Tax=Rhizophagus clarus TaxID=94130 RepID=A0A2Z6SDZ5_9GLOM|nr:hypothetical protein RclHR1_00080017 [Rhizophagus clarus]
MCSYFDTENWSLIGYLNYCKERSVLKPQVFEHDRYLQFLKLLENVPEKKIKAGNAIKVSLRVPNSYSIQYNINRTISGMQ